MELSLIYGKIFITLMEKIRQIKWSALIACSIIAGIVSGLFVIGSNDLRQSIIETPMTMIGTPARYERASNSSIQAKTRTISIFAKIKNLFLTASVNSIQPMTVNSVIQTPLTYKYGLSLAGSMYSLSDTQLNNRLNDIASLGIGWIRFDMSWVIVQPDDSATFHWSETDRIISAIRAHNIKILPILLEPPFWARLSDCQGDQKCMPANPTIFATFAQKAVERYAPYGVHTWEIWNEPNIPGFWKPAPNPKDYTELLKATYTAIKTADPSAKVVTGGLSPAATSGSDISPTDFLKGLYDNGAGGYFDAVGMHPYSFPVSPSNYKLWNAWSQMSLTPTNLRGIMTANGDGGKDIWMTEFGAPTGGPGALATLSGYSEGGSPYHLDESFQAKTMEDAINTSQNYGWAGPLFIYSYKDLGTSQDTNENFFGIIRYDGTHKPAYDTIKGLLVPPTPVSSSSSSTVSSSMSSATSSEVFSSSTSSSSSVATSSSSISSSASSKASSISSSSSKSSSASSSSQKSSSSSFSSKKSSSSSSKKSSSSSISSSVQSSSKSSSSKKSSSSSLKSSSSSSKKSSSSSLRSSSSSSLSSSSSEASNKNEPTLPAQSNGGGGGGGGGGSQTFFTAQITSVMDSSSDSSSSAENSLEKNRTEKENNVKDIASKDIKTVSETDKSGISLDNNISAQTVSDGGVNSVSVSSGEFVSKKLSIGMSDDSVKTLQSMLAKDSEIYPEGRITGFYGPVTVRAVKRFQRKYNIISSDSTSTSGFGLAGPKTRRKLIEIFGSGAVIQSTSTITNILNLKNNFTVSDEQVEILRKILIELMKKPSVKR